MIVDQRPAIGMMIPAIAVHANGSKTIFIKRAMQPAEADEKMIGPVKEDIITISIDVCDLLPDLHSYNIDLPHK